MSELKYYNDFLVGSLTETQSIAVQSAMSDVLAKNMPVYDDEEYATARRGAVQDMNYLRPLADDWTVNHWLRMSAKRMGMDPNELRIS